MKLTSELLEDVLYYDSIEIVTYHYGCGTTRTKKRIYAEAELTDDNEWNVWGWDAIIKAEPEIMRIRALHKGHIQIVLFEKPHEGPFEEIEM